MTVIPYKDQTASKKDQVAQMFDNISNNYDLLNRILSGGIDIIWRKKAISYLKSERPQLMLDVATGTGDFAIEAYKKLKPKKIIGVDISTGMLSYGREKIEKLGLQDIIDLKEGNSENLPFEDNTFDAVTVSFGVRNFENLEQGLRDIYRVLKKGGSLVVLEFSQPEAFPIKQFYSFYSAQVLPRIGKTISKDTSAYTYLPESVAAFPSGEDFLQIMQKVGFVFTRDEALTFGISSIYYGKK